MAKRRTGSVSLFTDAKGRDYYRGRIRLADKSREWVDVPDGYTEERARMFIAAVQAGEDREGRLLARKQARVVRTGETFAEWSARWVEDRKARGITSWNDDRGRLDEHIRPILGPLPMATITPDQIEDVRDSLDAKVRGGRLAWKTASHAWGLVTKGFDDAVTSKNRAIRVRSSNPVIGIKPPDKGAATGLVYLYPEEFLRLVSCEEVPLRWRRLFTLAVYTYARAGEIAALDWAAVDLRRAVLHIHKSTDRNTGDEATTKSEAGRRLPIETNLLPLLAARHLESGGSGRLAETSGTNRKLAGQLRRCLLIAGVARRELHVPSRLTKPISFHDLRATGITWCAVRGDDPLRIKQRAGHAQFSTTEGYIREAENLRDADFGQPFPRLPASLLSRDSERDNERGRLTKERKTMLLKVEAPGIEAASPEAVEGNRAEIVNVKAAVWGGSGSRNPANAGGIGIAAGQRSEVGRRKYRRPRLYSIPPKAGAFLWELGVAS